MSGLTHEDKQHLRGLGVTDAQVRKLARKFPSIKRALSRPPARNDVMDVLDRAEKAAAELVQIASASSLPANREALAHLGSASALVECEPADDSGDGSLPEVPDFAAAAQMLLSMSRLAKSEVRKGQRRGRSDSGRAVSLLLAAMQEPDDAKSRAFAKRVRPTHRPESTFGRIAEIVFGRSGEGAALGLRDAVEAWKRRPGRDVVAMSSAMPRPLSNAASAAATVILTASVPVQSGGSENTP